jgi:acyl dehydratase
MDEPGRGDCEDYANHRHPLLMERVQRGFEIPTFERMSDFHGWNRFAAVNEEFVPMHMDDEAGRAAGNPSAFGMGNLLLAYVHAALRQWIGDNGRIVTVAIQYRTPSFRGLRTIVGGTVVAVREEDGETAADLEIWAKTEEGTLMAPGTATVIPG